MLRLLPADAVTEHSIDTPRGKLAYTATAGTLAFYDQSGDQSASVFYTAYVAKDAPPNRPLTFVFNGGPGAASAFLHLGLVGPRILDFGPDGHDATRASLRDNPDTWLAFTDLVLIDPIGTGWSRAVKRDDAKSFWSVQSDAEAMAKAIALYVAKNNRAGSPKYLFGESYGGFRAAKVGTRTANRTGHSRFPASSCSRRCWKAGSRSATTICAACSAAIAITGGGRTRTQACLQSGCARRGRKICDDGLPDDTGRAPPKGDAASTFYERVAQMTGLPLDAVTQARGFAANAYVKTLRAPEARSSAAMTRPLPSTTPIPSGARRARPTRSSTHVSRAYGGAMASYARNELGFKTEMTYALLAGDVTGHWDWQSGPRAGQRRG